jgi:hypothetical protein
LSEASKRDRGERIVRCLASVGALAGAVLLVAGSVGTYRATACSRLLGSRSTSFCPRRDATGDLAYLGGSQNGQQQQWAAHDDDGAEQASPHGHSAPFVARLAADHRLQSACAQPIPAAPPRELVVPRPARLCGPEGRAPPMRASI